MEYFEEQKKLEIDVQEAYTNNETIIHDFKVSFEIEMEHRKWGIKSITPSINTFSFEAYKHKDDEFQVAYKVTEKLTEWKTEIDADDMFQHGVIGIDRIIIDVKEKLITFYF